MSTDDGTHFWAQKAEQAFEKLLHNIRNASKDVLEDSVRFICRFILESRVYSFSDCCSSWKDFVDDVYMCRTYSDGDIGKLCSVMVQRMERDGLEDSMILLNSATHSYRPEFDDAAFKILIHGLSKDMENAIWAAESYYGHHYWQQADDNLKRVYECIVNYVNKNKGYGMIAHPDELKYLLSQLKDKCEERGISITPFPEY